MSETSAKALSLTASIILGASGVLGVFGVLDVFDEPGPLGPPDSLNLL
jgi:hypothetical protein